MPIPPRAVAALLPTINISLNKVLKTLTVGIKGNYICTVSTQVYGNVFGKKVAHKIQSGQVR